MDDDAESIITNQRYEYIGSIIDACITKNRPKHALTLSDKIDQVVTNRFLGLPIFFIIMTLMYYISITTVGGWMTDWTNDVFFGEIVTDGAKGMLESMAAPEWLSGLVVDGIIGGVGTVLGFVPQILLIFFFMSLLEDSGYMFHHGPHLPSVRFIRQVFYPRTHRHGLRRACHHGSPHH